MKGQILLFVFLAPTLLFAQWSADPAKNLTIFPGADISVYYRSGGTIQGCKDGSVYITWFDLDAVLHVRRLDRDGFDIWAPDLVTFPPTGFPNIGSFTDEQENLYIQMTGYQPDINGYEFILLKVDKNGKKIFGENGILFQNPDRSDNLFNASCSVNGQENVLFSYSRVLGDTTFRIIHLIKKDGSMPWGENGLVLQGSIHPYIIFNQDDSFYILVYNYIGVQHDDSSYEVYMRKYNLEGKSLWDKDVMVFKGFMRLWTVNFLRESSGDFYMGWEPSWLQHMSADGFTEWDGGGLDLISDSTAWGAAPEFVGLNSKGELMIYFCRYDNHYKNPQLYGQLIGKQGQRLWGDTGRPIGINDFSGQYAYMNSEYRLKMNNDTVFLFYPYPLPAYPSHPYSIKAMAIDGEGRAVWPESIEVATERPYISLPMVTNFVNNQAILLWPESSSTKKGILKAQNIHTDGSIGVKSGSSRNEAISRKIQYIYNPDTRTIRFNGLTYPERYKLLNSSGQNICSGQAGQEIHLPELPQGIYVVTLLNGSTVIESCKVYIR